MISPAQPSAEQPRKSGLGYYLRSTPTRMGFNPVQANLTLTSHRLRIEPTRQHSSAQRGILMAAGGLQPVEFPLCRVTGAAIHEKRVWGKDDVLRIEFDNGGREYLWVEPAQEWQAAVLAARLAAPDLPYSTLPAVKNGVEASPTRSLAIVLLILLGVGVCATLLCVAAAIVNQAAG